LRSRERVVRLPPKLMAGARKSAREFGKSDPIDAQAGARAAIREGLEKLPQARLEGPEREIALLLDHREDLVAERTRIQQRLRWLLHDLDPEIEIPERALDREKWLSRLASRLARREQTVQVRILRELVRRCRELTREANKLERELTALVRHHAPQLLALPGCGALTAAKLVAEVAGVGRFPSDANLAMLGRRPGSTPPRASSCATASTAKATASSTWFCTEFAVTQGRIYAPAKAYLARRQAEGKTRKEALRALKRHLARRVVRILTLIANHINNPQRLEIRTAPHVPWLT
jgi:transposase